MAYRTGNTWKLAAGDATALMEDLNSVRSNSESEYEQEFCEGMIEKLEKYGERSTFTLRQWEYMEELKTKHLG